MQMHSTIMNWNLYCWIYQAKGKDTLIIYIITLTDIWQYGNINSNDLVL